MGGSAQSTAEVIVKRRSTQPKFQRKLQPCQAMEHSRVDLSVEVSGVPKPEVTWFLNDSCIEMNDRVKMYQRGLIYGMVILKAKVSF